VDITIHASVPKGVRVRLCETDGDKLETRAQYVAEQDSASATFEDVETVLSGSGDAIVVVEKPGDLLVVPISIEEGGRRRRTEA